MTRAVQEEEAWPVLHKGKGKVERKQESPHPPKVRKGSLAAPAFPGTWPGGVGYSPQVSSSGTAAAEAL